MIRVVVIDDERLSAGMMKRLLEATGSVDVIGVFTNPLEALRQLESGQMKPDAVFLDIEMPVIRGTELAQLIQNVNESIHILFVTAYTDYAIEAFELHSLDYVLKPVSQERLAKSVKRLQASLSRTLAVRSSTTLSIQCFSHFQLSDPDGHPLKWRTAKAKELCAFLVHHAGHTVDRDVILDTIWQDTPFDKALAQLYTITSYLRKMFAEAGLKQIIVKTNTGYRMEVGALRCDVLDFRPLALTHDEQALRQAALLYRGGYMEEEHYDWALSRQTELKTLAESVYRKLILICQSRGDLAEATASAEHMIRLAPYSDDACRLLMQLYADTGRRSDALLCFQRYEQAVRQELDAAPDRETASLYALIAKQAGA